MTSARRRLEILPFCHTIAPFLNLQPTMVLANHCPGGSIVSKARTQPTWGSFLIASIFVVFILGLCLARFGVLAPLLATGVSICVAFIYEAMNGSTPTQALVSSV